MAFSLGTVSFELELLFIYFRAEHLRRVCGDEIDELERQIRRPIYQELVEFILPRIKNENEIGRLVWSCTSADVIERALRGGCGDAVRRVVETECSAVIDAAELDLHNINLTMQQLEREDGSRSVAHVSVEGNRTWTAFELLLFTALFRTLLRNRGGIGCWDSTFPQSKRCKRVQCGRRNESNSNLKPFGERRCAA
jgi:hypothetical protein